MKTEFWLTQSHINFGKNGGCCFFCFQQAIKTIYSVRDVSELLLSHKFPGDVGLICDPPV